MTTVRFEVFSFSDGFDWGQISPFAQLQHEGDKTYLSVPFSYQLQDRFLLYGITHSPIPLPYHERSEFSAERGRGGQKNE